MLRPIFLPSPNYDSRGGASVDMLVLHYTGMPTAEDAIVRLCDTNARVSAHYVVDEDGLVFQLVEEQYRAWHAGVSGWRGNTNINARSIGIEIVNPGHEFGYRPFPAVQMQAVTALCKAVLGRHSIPARNVVGHSDIAPERKEDPGELFDWVRLAREGIGLWPNRDSGSGIQDSGEASRPTEPSAREAASHCERSSREQETKQNISLQTLQHSLAAYGYPINTDGEMTEQTRKVITAFQRHFRHLSLTGAWDAECESLLAALLQMG